MKSPVADPLKDRKFVHFLPRLSLKYVEARAPRIIDIAIIYADKFGSIDVPIFWNTNTA